MERGEWREGDHHTQRSSSFFVDQLSSHTWLPRRPQLFTDVLTPAVAATAPRRPGRSAAPLRCPGQQLHHARLGQSSPAPRLVFSRWRSSSAAPLTRRFSTASRPATHPPRRLCRCRHCAPASSVLPATSELPRRPGQHLPDGAPPRRTASNKPHPAEKSTPVWLAIWRIWAE